MQSSTFIVRDATAADAESVARLCTQLGYPTEAQAVPARLERLGADTNARVYVAVEKETVIGVATIHLRNTINHEAPIAQLTMLVVDEANQTHGVGRALVETAQQFARSNGSKRFTVTTALNRAGAHAFYERLGFTNSGRRYDMNLTTPPRP